MQWGWYGAGSGFIRGMNPYNMGGQAQGAYAENYRCPHGYVSAEHRMWGQNFEQSWVEQAWTAATTPPTPACWRRPPPWAPTASSAWSTG